MGDQVVATIDAIAEKQRDLFYDTAQWKKLPKHYKYILGASAVLMIFVCCSIQALGGYCFEIFQLTQKIEDPPLNGNALNIFKPLGWFVTVLFCISCILWYMFEVWALGEVKKRPEYQKLI